MAQPTFVPITEADQVRGARRLAVPKRWVADRPGDLRGPQRPSGTRHGTPGPDQGYALRLARRFEDRIHLTAAEDTEDVLHGAAILASKRSGLLGRAPCIYDLEAALAIFGFLAPRPPPELIAERREVFASVSRDYVAQRSLVDAVPDETLLMPAAKLTARLAEWQSLLRRAPSGELPPTS